VKQEAGFWALFAKGLAWLCKIPKIFFLKININIPTFYITSITFYHFSNKKITTKQKISLFYTKHFYFFSPINQICYSTNPLLSIQSLPKHNLGSGDSLLLKEVHIAYTLTPPCTVHEEEPIYQHLHP
jgi:hypothetical protein